MSRTHQFTGLLMGALAAASLIAPAQAQEDMKEPFQARYAELRSAMEARDAAALGKILAPEYEMVDVRGEVRTGAEMLERMATAKRPGPARKAETTVLKADIVGDKAVVEQQLAAGGTRIGDDGEEHTMEMLIISDDTWIKRADSWLLLRSVQKELTVKRDGEVFFQEKK